MHQSIKSRAASMSLELDNHIKALTIEYHSAGQNREDQETIRKLLKKMELTCRNLQELLILSINEPDEEYRNASNEYEQLKINIHELAAVEGLGQDAYTILKTANITLKALLGRAREKKPLLRKYK